MKDAYPEELLSVVLRATLDKNPNLDPAKIDDVAVGVVLSELGGSKAARMAMNHVGYSNTTSLYTINRACSSSLQSLTTIAAQLRTDMIGVGVAAGMESMTRNYGSRAIPVDLWPDLKNTQVKDAADCIMPMGITSENVAERYQVNRADQDAFAVESHRRAAKAQKEGLFDEEIVPVTTRFQETDKQGNKVGEEQTITATRDDGIRASATLEGLAKLKPAFKTDGTSTAGNSSQVSDGAAATLLMRRSTATELGLTSSIIGKFVNSVTVGCKPDEMGIGPALAIPKLLKHSPARLSIACEIWVWSKSGRRALSTLMVVPLPLVILWALPELEWSAHSYTASDAVVVRLVSSACVSVLAWAWLGFSSERPNLAKDISISCMKSLSIVKCIKIIKRLAFHIYSSRVFPCVRACEVLPVTSFSENGTPSLVIAQTPIVRMTC